MSLADFQAVVSEALPSSNKKSHGNARDKKNNAVKRISRFVMDGVNSTSSTKRFHQ
jgi:hypothetical protein